MSILSEHSVKIRKATYDVCPFCGSPYPDCVGAYNCPSIKEYIKQKEERLEAEKQYKGEK